MSEAPNLVACSLAHFATGVDWNSVFVPTMSLLEIVIRGTIVYLVLFFVLRVVRRDAGSLGIADLLVVVIIADAAQNAMGSKYESVTEGIVLVGTIVFWNFALDWLAFHVPFFQRIVRGRPVLLIRNGELMRRNLQREMITREELISQLREQGIEDVSKVKTCYLEGDGHISVVSKGK